MSEQRLKAIATYAFAGGVVEGVKKHFDVIEHLAENKYEVQTFNANHPKTPTTVGVENWAPVIKKYMGRDIDFLFGNPPCAAWSPLGPIVQGDSDSWKTDERLECTRNLERLIEAIYPRVAAWESVPQAWSKGREFQEDLLDKLNSIGYDYCYIVKHDAQYVGTPQSRRRIWFVASRIPITWRTPFTVAPTTMEILSSIDTTKTFDGEACHENQPFQNNFPKWFLRMLKPGSVRSQRYAYVDEHPEADSQITKPGFAWRRLGKDKISSAMIGPTFIHPTESRALTIREMKILCGFPLKYKLHGTTLVRAQAIARGIMPPVGKWLAKNVKLALENRKQEEHEPGLWLIDHQAPPATEERIKTWA